jgi:hypothetical protein
VQDKIDVVLAERRKALAERVRRPDVTTSLDHLRELPALQRATT